MEDDLDPKHYRKEPRGLLAMALIVIITLFVLALANISGLIGLGLIVVAIAYLISFCCGLEFTLFRVATCFTSAAVGIGLCAFHLYFGYNAQPTRKR